MVLKFVHKSTYDTNLNLETEWRPIYDRLVIFLDNYSRKLYFSRHKINDCHHVTCIFYLTSCVIFAQWRKNTITISSHCVLIKTWPLLIYNYIYITMVNIWSIIGLFHLMKYQVVKYWPYSGFQTQIDENRTRYETILYQIVSKIKGDTIQTNSYENAISCLVYIITQFIYSNFD